MGSLFGTDGIRGVAGSYPLDTPTIYACAQSLVRHLEHRLGRPPRILIGRDPRESGRWIEGILVRGMIDHGAEVVSVGVIPTPGIAYLTRTQAFDAGVVISASHNPIPDNGIKLFSHQGMKFDDELERLIEKDIGRLPGPTRPIVSPWLDSEESLRRLYIRYLIDEIGRGLDLSGLSVALDCAHGAASEIAPQVFEALGARVKLFAAEPDGKNINRGCGAVHIAFLAQRVANESCDLGIAFDGDADRALFVGPDGRVFDGDQTLYALALQWNARGQLDGNLVVATVMSNWGLEKGLKEHGIQLHRTPVGDRYVLEKLLELGGSLGGEQSGHIILPRISLAGDGLITALEVLRLLREHRCGLDELTAGFTRYPQKLVNVRVRAKPPFETIPRIVAAKREIEQQLEGRGRLVLRYSGTEDRARIMIEADDPDLVDRLVHQLAQTIQQCLGTSE